MSQSYKKPKNEKSIEQFKRLVWRYYEDYGFEKTCLVFSQHTAYKLKKIIEEKYGSLNKFRRDIPNT